MTTLYNLSQQMVGLRNMMEDDELTFDLTDTIDGLEGDIQLKAEGLLAYVANLSTDVQAIENEITRLKQRKDVIQNRQESLREYLRYNMAESGIDKITCPLFTITLRKATDICVIESENLIPEMFKERVEEVRIDKMAIKRHLKDGMDVPGARLEAGKRGLMIK